MRQGITIVLLLLFAVPAAALQIGDGYNNDTYNGHAYSQSDNAFLTMQAKSSGVPVGTIISWPLGENPEDAENWLECDGQAVPTGYELRKYMVNTPDLRGYFLRGNGGDSAALMTSQAAKVYFPPNSVSASMNDLPWSYASQAGVNDSEFGAMGVKAVSLGWVSNNGHTSGSNSLNTRLSVNVESTNIILRPQNKSVRYLIRAQ